MNERSIKGQSVSTYDRSRLLGDDDPKPNTITTLKDVHWEHQAAAIGKGYRSVIEMVVDEMAAEIRSLNLRVEALEQQVAPEVEPAADYSTK